jgi:hypothetical protein
VEYPLTLVLGDDVEERFSADDEHNLYTIYLKAWSESRFTAVTTLIAVRRLAFPAQKRMVTEILKRARSILPVGVEQLSSRPVSGQ